MTSIDGTYIIHLLYNQNRVNYCINNDQNRLSKIDRSFIACVNYCANTDHNHLI